MDLRTGPRTLSRRALFALLACVLSAKADLLDDLRFQHEALGITALHDSLQRRGQAPGEGLRIAVIDNGFCLRHRSLAHLQTQGIVDSWDYLNRNAQGWDTLPRLSHGSATLGILASRWDSLPGIAPAASWLLYRSEVDSFERLEEEQWLAQAITRAVDSGAQVISISLGYRFYFNDSQNFPWNTMDGLTHASSLAATQAARRGAVVVVAMGNDDDSLGGSPSIGAPADAPEILSIGAVAEDGSPCGFSSAGPTFDGRTKPDLVGFGCPVPTVDASSDNGSIAFSGTSFAAPMIAGVVALTRQLHPEWTPAQVIAALKTTASQGASPDAKRGWGLPDLRKLPASVGIARARPARPDWTLDRDGRFTSRLPLAHASLEIWNLAGQKLSSTRLPALGANQAVPVGPLPRGLVIARLQGVASASTQRLLVP